MPDKAWKAAERSLAAILGGVRIPNSGFGQPDVVAGNLAIQLKYRKNGIPQWILDAVDQSKIDAGEGQMAVLVLHSASPGKKARRLAVVELEDLLEDSNE